MKLRNVYEYWLHHSKYSSVMLKCTVTLFSCHAVGSLQIWACVLHVFGSRDALNQPMLQALFLFVDLVCRSSSCVFYPIRMRFTTSSLHTTHAQLSSLCCP